MELIEFLNDYFDDNNEAFSIRIDPSKTKNLVKKYWTKYEKSFENYHQDYNTNLKSDQKPKTAIYNILSSALNSFLDPRSENLIKESLNILLEDIEEYFQLQPYFDNNCYVFFNTLFNQVFKKNPSKLLEIINMHNIYFKDEFPIDKKIEQINIVTEVQEDYSILWEKLTIKEVFDPENFNFIEKLTKAKKQEQRKYLDDWSLKFAQLAENYYKKCLFTCCRVNALAKNTILSKYDNLPKSSIKFASVLKAISQEYNKFLNVDKIRIMRNAIYHGNMKFYMDGEWETYQICFYDRKKKVKRTINEFINDYFKLIKFAFTLDLVCKIFELKIKYPNKSLSELLLEGLKIVLPISLEELRKLHFLKKVNFPQKILRVLVIMLKFFRK